MGIYFMEDSDFTGYWIDAADIDIIIYMLNKSDSEYKEISRDTIEHIFNNSIKKEELICLKDFNFIENIIKNYSNSKTSEIDSQTDTVSDKNIELKIDKIREKHNIPEDPYKKIQTKFSDLNYQLEEERKKIDTLEFLKKELDEIHNIKNKAKKISVINYRYFFGFIFNIMNFI